MRDSDGYFAQKLPGLPSSELAKQSFEIQKCNYNGPPLPLTTPIGRIVHFTNWIFWFSYICTRVAQTWIAQCSTPFTIWGPWALLWCEVAAASQEFLVAFELTLGLFASKKARTIESLRLTSSSGPTVDVFITVCGEDRELAIDTIRAAVHQDYPPDCYRVFVLDDGQDELLRRDINILNRERNKSFLLQDVVYVARQKTPGVPHYFKSGNLRHGIEVSRAKEYASEYIAALDVDRIPEENWLTRVVPHMILDPTLALANVPQTCYNIPDPDALAQDTHMWQMIQEPVRGVLGTSQCHGSGFVMRRSALDEIGGWPLSNVGEDILCSCLLINAGWRTKYVNEELQRGFDPDSMHSFIKQRIRWSDGDYLLLKQVFGMLFVSATRKGSTTNQMLTSVMVLACRTVDILNMSVVILLLTWFPNTLQNTSGFESVSSSMTRNILLAWWISCRVTDYVTFRPVGMQNYENSRETKYWQLPYTIFCMLRSASSTKIKFEAAGTLTGANERSATLRKGLFTRILTPSMLLHIFLLGLTLSVACRVVYSGLVQRMEASENISCFLFTGAVLRSLEMVSSFSVPVLYIIFPPTVPARRDMLEKGANGVYRPRKRAGIKRRWMPRVRLILEIFVILAFDWL